MDSGEIAILVIGIVLFGILLGYLSNRLWNRSVAIDKTNTVYTPIAPISPSISIPVAKQIVKPAAPRPRVNPIIPVQQKKKSFKEDDLFDEFMS